MFIIWTNEVLQDEIYLMEKIPTLFYTEIENEEWGLFMFMRCFTFY